MGKEDKGGGAKKGGAVRKKGKGRRERQTPMYDCVNMFTCNVEHETIDWI